MNRNYLGLNFRQRAARRRVVVAAYLSCCAIVIALTAGSRPGMDLLKLLAFSPFVVMAVCWWILNQVGIAYTGSATHPLDERQEQVRNRAFFRSYQTICALTSLALPSTSSRVFENTIFGVSFQMRANSSSCSGVDGFSSAVSQYAISS